MTTSMINTNIGALNALKSLDNVNDRLAVSQLRLATGKRINSASDDAAGYSISKKFNVRSECLGQAISNIGSAKNLISVAEGHLNNIVNILTQMRTKATQAADDSLGTAERNAINLELFALTSQIDLEVNQATWNSKSLLNGNKTNGDSDVLFKFQIGAGNSLINDILKFDLFNKQNVNFSIGNTGFSATKLQLNEGGAPIDLTKSFAEAGFEIPPNGRITINGGEYPDPPFTISVFSTVQSFLNSVQNNTQANITYDSTTNKFSVTNKNSLQGEDLIISETGIPGFFTAAKIPVGTYKAPSRL